MERKPGLTNLPQEKPGKVRHEIPCEIPRTNGSKPAVPERVSEERKKHVRRDGRR